MEPLIIAFAEKYPVAVTILAGVGVLRAIFKPIMSVARAYVQSTKSTDDDLKLDEVESSKAFKALAWLVDYVASIKIAPKK